MQGKVFDGPVWIQAQQVIRYFEDNFHASYNIRDPRTNATHVVDNWPPLMFAELATNCILHKEYSRPQLKMTEESQIERSLKEVLKEVLKEADYRKVEAIAELIDEQGTVTPAEAKKICGKSDSTTWRYLGILTETGYVVSEGKTNQSVYRRATEANRDGSP